jgi:transcriptional regulator GlxA family with amidase domain
MDELLAKLTHAFLERLHGQGRSRTAKTVEAMRLEAAVRALESTDLPLKTIADQVGYKDDQVMRRVFMRRWGVTPLQFRQRFASTA